MSRVWQPTAEELVKLRAAIVEQHPELAEDESAITAMVERAIAFTQRWEPHIFPGDDRLG